MTVVSVGRVTNWALRNAPEYRDSSGEVNLIELEESAQEAFQLTDEEFEGQDISFEIFRRLQRAGMV